MDLRGAVILDKTRYRLDGGPATLVSAIADEELGDGRLRYRVQTLLGYDRKGRPIYQVKGSSRQTWQESLSIAEVDSTALANSTAATTIIPAAARFTLPANFMDVGKMLRVTLKGRISNIVTTPGTITLDVRFGSTVVFNGGAVSMNTTAKTNVTFIMDAGLVCRTIGATTAATMLGIGQFQSESVVGAAAGTTVAASLPASAPAAGTGFDSTVANVVDLFGTFSIANAGNSIQSHIYVLESMN
jgi:hypothetical protein